MTIRIHTARLLELLGELRHTTHPDPDMGAVHGILLHTTRGHHVPGEPGVGDILAGTSSMHYAVGHTHVPAFGQMTGPMLWPLDRALHVMSWFKTEAKDNPDHTVEIGYDGKIITVRAGGDPTLFGNDGDDQLEFRGLDVAKYPRGLWRVLQWDDPPTDETTVLQARSDIKPALLDPFVKVAGKRTIELYRYHQARPILVGIGEKYRGAIMPGRWDDMNDNPSLGASPYGEVYDPKLPVITEPQPDPESSLELAAEKVLTTQIATVGMLARALKVNPKAAETLLDELEVLGVVSADTGRGRDVLATKAQLGAILEKIRANQPQQPTLDSDI